MLATLKITLLPSGRELDSAPIEMNGDWQTTRDTWELCDELYDLYAYCVTNEIDSERVEEDLLAQLNRFSTAHAAQAWGFSAEIVLGETAHA